MSQDEQPNDGTLCDVCGSEDLDFAQHICDNCGETELTDAGGDIDWSKAEPWANFIATDSNGTRWQYECMPRINDEYRWYRTDVTTRMSVYSVPDVDTPCPNWKESLVKRPVVIEDYKFNPIIQPSDSQRDYDHRVALKLAGRLANAVENYLSSNVANSANRMKVMIDALGEYNDYILDEVRTRPEGG